MNYDHWKLGGSDGLIRSIAAFKKRIKSKECRREFKAAIEVEIVKRESRYRDKASNVYVPVGVALGWYIYDAIYMYIPFSVESDIEVCRVQWEAKGLENDALNCSSPQTSLPSTNKDLSSHPYIQS